jgi:hypothetical protein
LRLATAFTQSLPKHKDLKCLRGSSETEYIELRQSSGGKNRQAAGFSDALLR